MLGKIPSSLHKSGYINITSKTSNRALKTRNYTNSVSSSNQLSKDFNIIPRGLSNKENIPKSFFGGTLPKPHLEQIPKYETIIEDTSPPNAVQLVDFEGRIHGIVSITGMLKNEVDNPSAQLHIGDEIGKGSEKQIHIGDLKYKNDDDMIQVKVAVTIQNIEHEKKTLWSPIKIVNSFFKMSSSEVKINQDKIEEAKLEYESMKKIGYHPNLDTTRLMGMGLVIDNRIINIAILAKGDMLALPAKDLNFPTILTLMKQGAEAIAFMHSKEYSHNDIKPENFLLYQKEDGEYYIKLADFGHTRKIGEIADKSLGTPSFAPIEKGTRISQKQDQWAFAQSCLDFFVVEFANYSNEEQKKLYIEVNQYFSNVMEGVIPDNMDDVVAKLEDFIQRAKQLDFSPLGEKVNYKGKIKNAEEKRL
jgi:hypothetical protein